MNVSDVIGRSVLDLSTATTVGRVDDVVIDPRSRRLVGFHLAKVSGSATWLPWEALRSLGADALTIDGAEALTEPPADERAGLRARRAFGGRVLTDSGHELPSLTNFDVDPESGAVNGVAVGDRTVPGESLIGIGSYATVVAEPGD